MEDTKKNFAYIYSKIRHIQQVEAELKELENNEKSAEINMEIKHE